MDLPMTAQATPNFKHGCKVYKNNCWIWNLSNFLKLRRFEQTSRLSWSRRRKRSNSKRSCSSRSLKTLTNPNAMRLRLQQLLTSYKLNLRQPPASCKFWSTNLKMKNSSSWGFLMKSRITKRLWRIWNPNFVSKNLKTCLKLSTKNHSPKMRPISNSKTLLPSKKTFKFMMIRQASAQILSQDLV